MEESMMEFVETTKNLERNIEGNGNELERIPNCLAPFHS